MFISFIKIVLLSFVFIQAEIVFSNILQLNNVLNLSTEKLYLILVYIHNISLRVMYKLILNNDSLYIGKKDTSISNIEKVLKALKKITSIKKAQIEFC